MNKRLETMLEMDGNGSRMAPSARGFPHSDDAEKGFLGSLLQRPALIDDTADLPLEAIYDLARRAILEAMREMTVRLIAVDMITLTERLENGKILDTVGGAAAIAELFTFVPAAGNWKQYLEIIRDKWVRREVLAMAFAQQEIAYEEAENIEAVVARCEETAMKLREKTMPGNSDQVRHCREAAEEAMAYIERVYKHRGHPLGLTTGIADWDRMTNGFKAEELIIIGARPATGKTSLGLQVAEHNAIDCRRPTLFFSLEMSASNLMKRTLLSRTEVDQQKLRDGFFSREDMTNVRATLVKVSGAPLYIDRTGELTVAQLRSRARSAKVRHKIELIVVDYLQLMRSMSKRAEHSRQVEIAEIAEALKAVAKELRIPVIALCQLNRDVEALSRKPKSADLRESGAIEQAADQVLLIWRLDKDKKKPKEGKEPELPPDHNTILILDKQRDGPTGDIKVKFIPELTHFEGLTKKLYSNKEEERQH